MIHSSAASGYERHADTYARARPGYHSQLIERFVARYSAGTVVDLGAGTGIFTRQLVESGCLPIAIEPVKKMCAMLSLELPNIDVRNGTAEDTGLDTASIDTVVAAQAFHWFNYRAALAEIRRVLRPGGVLVCVWNTSDESVDWVAKYTEILDEYADGTPRRHTLAWRRAIEADPAFEPIDEWAVENPQETSPDGVAERALSTSFIAALPAELQRRVVDDLRDLVAPLGERFEFPYRCELQAWRKRQDQDATPGC